MMGAHANDRVSMRWWIGEDCVMVASDDGAEEGDGGSVCAQLAYPHRTYHNQRLQGIA